MYPSSHDGGSTVPKVGDVGDRMRVKIGTFNLNNLFSRFNFSAGIS